MLLLREWKIGRWKQKQRSWEEGCYNSPDKIDGMALTGLAMRNDWIQDLGGDRVGKTLEKIEGERWLKKGLYKHFDWILLF